jgi:hypothetical protein
MMQPLEPTILVVKRNRFTASEEEGTGLGAKI